MLVVMIMLYLCAKWRHLRESRLVSGRLTDMSKKIARATAVILKATLCQNAPVSTYYCYVFIVGFITYLLLLCYVKIPVSTCYCYMSMVGFITYLLLFLYYVKMSLSQHITAICSWWALLLIYYYFIMSKCPCLNILLLYVHDGLYYLFIIITLLCQDANVSTYY